MLLKAQHLQCSFISECTGTVLGNQINLNFTRINIAFTGGLFSSTTTSVNLQLFSQNFKCVKQDFSVLIRIYTSV